MKEQTIKNVINALDKCTMQACVVCPYNGRNACKYEMHKDAYEALTYLDGLHGKALEIISSMKEDIEAKKILAEVAGMTVNDSIDQLTARIIFGECSNPRNFGKSHASLGILE